MSLGPLGNGSVSRWGRILDFSPFGMRACPPFPLKDLAKIGLLNGREGKTIILVAFKLWREWSKIIGNPENTGSFTTINI